MRSPPGLVCIFANETSAAHEDRVFVKSFIPRRVHTQDLLRSTEVLRVLPTVQLDRLCDLLVVPQLDTLSLKLTKLKGSRELSTVGRPKRTRRRRDRFSFFLPSSRPHSTALPCSLLLIIERLQRVKNNHAAENKSEEDIDSLQEDQEKKGGGVEFESLGSTLHFEPCWTQFFRRWAQGSAESGNQS